jgi:hypothetical protein
MTIPSRIYTFTYNPSDGVGWYVQWTDSWYNQFERKNMTVTSQPMSLAQAFPLPPFTFTGIQQNGATSTTRTVTMSPFTPAPGTTVSVGALAPALLGLSVACTYFEVGQLQNGQWVGISDQEQAQFCVGVDISQVTMGGVWQNQVQWDYALAVNSAPQMFPVGSNPVQLPAFPGDYRRPVNAPMTQMLTDDELWSVGALARAINIAETSLLGMLITLTGARRTAFHPADGGHYGISNLTAAQIAAGGITDITEFINGSVHRQLAVTQKYLAGLAPAVSGVLPVFFTLATGTPQRTVSAPIPVAGVPMTAAAATQQINYSTTQARNEYLARVPASVTPVITAAG